MMRKLLMTAAVFAAAALSVSTTGAPPARAQSGAAVAQADRDFYFAVLRGRTLNAPDDQTLNWTRDGRGGTVRFGPERIEQNGAYGCRDFFVREIAPVAKAPVTGTLCVTEPNVSATSGGATPPPTPIARVDERGTRFDLRRLDVAVAAGPRGEPGGTRGIVIPSPQPQPQPQPQPRPQPPPSPITEDRPRSVQAPPPRPNVIRRTDERARTQVNIKPVLVQIGKRSARANQNGGHAVVLLTRSPQTSARNLALCTSLLNNFDDAPLSDILVGVRREPDGTISALRAIYWPVDDTRTATGAACAERLARYDYTRAQTIRDKHRLTGPGPYLLVSRNDEQQAAAINLAGMSAPDIEKATLYFRDAFSQKGNIWNPQGFNRQREEQSLVARWGAGFSRALVSAVEFYSGGPASAATPVRACVGDLTDTRPC